MPGEPRATRRHHLELSTYDDIAGALAGRHRDSNHGAAHLAFAVEAIDAHYQRLVAAGVHFFSPPNLITAGVNTGGYTCYFHDPDQIVLEILQPP